jgi:hypothetical protein
MLDSVKRKNHQIALGPHVGSARAAGVGRGPPAAGREFSLHGTVRRSQRPLLLWALRLLRVTAGRLLQTTVPRGRVWCRRHGSASSLRQRGSARVSRPMAQRNRTAIGTNSHDNGTRHLLCWTQHQRCARCSPSMRSKSHGSCRNVCHGREATYTACPPSWTPRRRRATSSSSRMTRRSRPTPGTSRRGSGITTTCTTAR